MKLQFTNGYRPRFDQISRILRYLLSQEKRRRIPRQEIVAALGIPDNQVENLTSMMTGFGLVQPRVTTLTPFGRAVIQRDPYFERIETLWIVHYIVSSNPEWVVWYRVVNIVIPTLPRISVEYVSQQFFGDLAEHFSEKTIAEKLPKEVGAVLAAYSRSELSRLNILQEEKTGNFLRSNPTEIPGPAFLFCLLAYRARYFAGSTAMNMEDICMAQNSPGRVLNLAEYRVREILDNLHYASLIRLEKFANLDQVRLSDAMSQESVLRQIYAG